MFKSGNFCWTATEALKPPDLTLVVVAEVSSVAQIIAAVQVIS